MCDILHTLTAAGQFPEDAAIIFGTVLPSSETWWLNVIVQKEMAKPKGFILGGKEMKYWDHRIRS